MTNFPEDDEDILIPFILTKKNGGMYDDDAFSAGWHLAMLDAQLSLAVSTGLIAPPVPLKVSWRKQADLIAMSHSLLVKMIPTDDPEVAFFLFGDEEFFSEGDDDADNS